MKHSCKTCYRASAGGFTLIELSIVLVIIGLIIGGILTGKDLIQAASLRALLTQIDQYNQAANSFHSKYNGLPGDFNNPASIIAGVSGNSATTEGEGNGNGLIESSGTAHTYGFAGEPAMFFAELSADGGIPQIIQITSFAVSPGLPINDQTMPPTKLGENLRISVGNDGTSNYYLIGQFGGTITQPLTDTTTGAFSTVAGLTVGQALQIDTKIDDGVPNTGSVFSIGVNSGTGMPPDPAVRTAAGTNGASGTVLIGNGGTCYDSGSNVYLALNLSSVACNLAVRTSF